MRDARKSRIGDLYRSKETGLIYKAFNIYDTVRNLSSVSVVGDKAFKYGTHVIPACGTDNMIRISIVRKPFNRDMVLALLAGTKTQTRRKGKLDAFPGDIIAVTEAFWSYGIWRYSDKLTKTGKKKREWMPNPSVPILYDADHPEEWKTAPVPNEPGKWRKIPPMHMPLKYSRIFLEVERSWRGPLQDMSPADAIAEGIQELLQSRMQRIEFGGNAYRDYASKDKLFSKPLGPIKSYKSLWDSINEGDFKWEFNPEVSAYQFKLLEGYKL